MGNLWSQNENVLNYLVSKINNIKKKGSKYEKNGQNSMCGVRLIFLGFKNQ